MFYASVILLVGSVFLYIYWRLRETFSYFERRNVPYVEPSWIFGNSKDIVLRRRSFIESINELYYKLEPHKFGGAFQVFQPTFVIRDPEILKHVLIKDFDHFQDRNPKFPDEEDLFAQTLFSLKGEKWKNLRIKLTSTFTSGKMKMMFPLVNDCGKNLLKVLTTLPSGEPLDVKSLTSRYTMDVIGTCAFGIETRCLTNLNSQFEQMGRKIFRLRYRTILLMIWKNIPKSLIKLFKITIVEEEVQNFYLDIIKKAIKHREENNVTRYDFLDLILALKNNTILDKHPDKGEKEDLEKFLNQIGNNVVKSNVEMTPELLTAQCILFFFAGFETSSGTLSFMLMELAKNHEIQNKVRDEINDLLEKYEGQVTYDLLKNMPYTDMVLAETLRKYPPTGWLVRVCTKTYTIPNTEVIIPVDTPIFMPLLGLHHDSKYYEKPNEFYPEHFAEEAKAKRPHFTYMPFGEGPRVCIAERFAKMQVKIGLIYMLKDFSYNVSNKMKFPITYVKNTIITAVEGGIWLECKPIKK